MTFDDRRWALALAIALTLLGAAACGGDGEADTDAADTGGRQGSASAGAGERGAGGRRGSGPGGPGGPGGQNGPGGPEAGAGVPVQVTAAVRAPIALYFETNGTLEAENDVDLVARSAGPIVTLRGEQGMSVAKGQLLARIDDSEIRAQLAVAQVRLEETKAAFERIESLYDNELVSRDDLDRARAAYETALGDIERSKIQLQFTEIRAPFAGQIAERYVRLAEYVTAGTRLFRIADFDPLLCPIQVPERELPRLALGQPARLEAEAWPGRSFAARVLRISPVVEAETGTVEVTLEVSGEGVLRPGMFASVFLEMARREDALVIPKRALALDSLGDTVFVAVPGDGDGDGSGTVAERRTVELGFESAELLEVARGLEAGERVVTVGQDGLADGTPIEILGDEPAADAVASAPPSAPSGAQPGARRPGGRGAFFADVDWSDPEQVERVKARMRERGLSEAQIEERIARIKERLGGG